MAPLEELTEAYLIAKDDQSIFSLELGSLLGTMPGGRLRCFMPRVLQSMQAARRFNLKREDLLHTAHTKINNTLGQVLLARRMGKKRVIAETGAGQHGVATATVCALFWTGLCCLYGPEISTPGTQRVSDGTAGR